MIIDFHAHVFPERIAARTVALLEKNAGTHAHSDGTAEGLEKRLVEAGVDLALNLPVLTSPTQFESVLGFAEGLNLKRAEGARVLSFAGMHPDLDDIEGRMRLIKEKGFLGVKIHPDYQGRFINDPGYIRIIECARDLDLIVVTHSGVDEAFTDAPVRCTPELALEVCRRVPYRKMVFAHLGANEMFDEVLDALADREVYFDTANVLPKISEETFMRTLSRIGEDRILFATDSPWSGIKESIEIIKSFSLRKEAEEKIFAKNAMALLGV